MQKSLPVLSYAVLELVQALLAHVTLAGFERVAEELEPLPRLPAVADTRLFGMQREAVFAQPGAHLREGGVRLLARPAQDDEVVRIGDLLAASVSVLVAVQRCGRSGSYRRDGLMARFGGNIPPDLLVALSSCERRADFSKPCGARYTDLAQGGPLPMG